MPEYIEVEAVYEKNIDGCDIEDEYYRSAPGHHNFIFNANGIKYVWVHRGNSNVPFFREGCVYKIRGRYAREIKDGIKLTHLEYKEVKKSE